MAIWDNHKKYKDFKCKICNDKFFSFYGVFNNFTGIKCDNCGTVQVKENISLVEIEEFYSNNYYDDYYNGLGYIETYNQHLKNSFIQKIKIINNLVKSKNISILEVGGGLGYFSKTLIDNNYKNVELWEINDDSIFQAKKLGIDAKKINIFDTTIENKFDIVVSWATIEHVDNPKLFINKLMKLVKKNGYLLVDTGIIDTYRDNYSEGISGWFYPPEHLYCFSKKSLLMLVDDCQEKRVMINADKKKIYILKLNFKFFIKKLLFRKIRNGCFDIGMLICKK